MNVTSYLVDNVRLGEVNYYRLYECESREESLAVIAGETRGKVARKRRINIFDSKRAQRRFRSPKTHVQRSSDTVVATRFPRQSLRRVFFASVSQLSTSSKTMYCYSLLLMAVAAAQATLYLPPIVKEDQFPMDNFLRKFINQMGDDLGDFPDSYMEYQDKPKEIPIELPVDFDGIDTLNPNPSIRDQEYLRHSSLYSHQRMNNKDSYGARQKIKPGSTKYIKEEKTENTLPAYCTPPNPCPIGYSSENNCIVNFVNTAAFSRDYQSAQDCMCDSEHMLDCPIDSSNSNSLTSMHIPNSNFNQIVDQIQAEENPFFRGEKLPIAAKKGINVEY